MIKLNTKLAAVAGLSAALLTGCGGGGGGSAGNGSGGGTQTIDSASVVGFLKQLSSNGENSDPIDINSLTLAADDTADFTPII